MGLTSAQSEPILSVAEINSGMVFPVVAQTFLGTFGIILMMVLMLFAIMSTGAGQVISIAALIIYDIYMPYVRPFHEDHKARANKQPICFIRGSCIHSDLIQTRSATLTFQNASSCAQIYI